MQSESAETLRNQIAAGFNEINEALEKVADQESVAAQAKIIADACERMADLGQKLTEIELPAEEMSRLHSIFTSAAERTQAEVMRLTESGHAHMLTSAISEAWGRSMIPPSLTMPNSCALP